MSFHPADDFYIYLDGNFKKNGEKWTFTALLPEFITFRNDWSTSLLEILISAELQSNAVSSLLFQIIIDCDIIERSILNSQKSPILRTCIFKHFQTSPSKSILFHDLLDNRSRPVPVRLKNFQSITFNVTIKSEDVIVETLKSCYLCLKFSPL